MQPIALLAYATMAAVVALAAAACGAFDRLLARASGRAQRARPSTR